ncbi:CHAD domain-containing protein [Paraburkholderia sp. A2WS-5]|uniref:CHAD domain-containing protein n=1 Tax=unclassified Paraburkholderia TaxID=2615204 RepID=UPI003B7D1957
MTGKRHRGKVLDAAQARFAGYAKPLVSEALTRAARLDGHEDDYHKLRVALRRLRTLLWAWRPLFGRDLDEPGRASLKRMAAAAGDARNWDIAAGLLAQQGEERIANRLAASRGEARDAARRVLAGRAFRRNLLETVRRANRMLNASPRRAPMKRFARARVASAERALDKRMRRAKKAGRRDYAALHDVRKRAKRLRYLLEFFGPHLPRRRGKRMKRLKKIQDRFGNLNDVVSAEHLLACHREIFDADAGADAALASLGKLRKRRRRAAMKLLA